MRVVIVTGMSGAGKTTALKMLEDLGFYCVDNLPIRLINKFVELLTASGSQNDNVALGIDIRNPESIELLSEVVDDLKRELEDCRVLFLDASDACLIKRYKETRRSHPLAPYGRVEAGILTERNILNSLHSKADYVINTSKLLTRELKGQIADIFAKGEEYHNLFITVMSFGFKYGIPDDADLVFDVRFLPNPYYYEEMRYLTGNDSKVSEYVMNNDTAQMFITKLIDMIKFLIPHYIDEGKSQLVIAIGCTGGRHRSVAIANALFDALQTEKGFGKKLDHRDIDNDSRHR